MIIGKWNKSVILTYIGLAFTIVGIYFALTKHINFAFCCLMISGICDMFDGKVARMCKRTPEEIQFGIELDSLVDVVCFVVFPIIISICIGFTAWYNIISYVLLGICGVARLCYFNVCTATKDGKAVPYYEGLPVTVSSATFPLFYLLHLVISNFAFKIIFSALIFLEAILNVIRIRICKPKSILFTIFVICLFVILVAFVL